MNTIDFDQIDRLPDNEEIYQISVVEKTNSKKNKVHSYIDGSKGIIVLLAEGMPLLGYYVADKDDNKPHRFFTSNVLNINIKEDGNIFVETSNSFYKFKKIN